MYIKLDRKTGEIIEIVSFYRLQITSWFLLQSFYIEN